MSLSPAVVGVYFKKAYKKGEATGTQVPHDPFPVATALCNAATLSQLVRTLHVTCLLSLHPANEHQMFLSFAITSLT